MNSNAII